MFNKDFLLKNMEKNISADSHEIMRKMDSLNKRFSGKKILLTGAAGFLGQQFAYYFTQLNILGTVSEPVSIYLYDNFMRGVPESFQVLESFPNVRVQMSDIVSEKTYPEADFIIHSASIASPIYYRKYPIETIDANVTGLRNLLEHASKTCCESFLNFSTSEIYGDPDPAHIPTKEDYRGNVSCTGPRACYDESKRLGETLCVNFWDQRKVPVKIARPFNNYGPGLKITDKRVLPDFFRNVLHDQNIVLFSDGKATRTFCYASDALTGYLKLLLSDFNGESFNIGNDSPEINMIDLAQHVIKISGKHLNIEYKANNDFHYLTDNPNRRCPDLSKTKSLLNYAPSVQIEEGLERTYRYYLDNMDEKEEQ
jgi:dTDP-glucose 4,6-dehydratase/UDP-glucuronate decarboxylase